LDEATTQALAAQTGLPSGIVRVLQSQGLTSANAISHHLQPQLASLHDPFAMKDMRVLVNTLATLRRHGDSKLLIHGDYDADGLTSTALLTRGLRAMGFTVIPFVPDRIRDGYGVARRAIDVAVAAGVTTMLTCDTGSSAVDEVAYATSCGMTVLITDHHTPPDVLPVATALVNPTQTDCPYPFKGLCGVGVAYKVLQAMAREFNLNEQALLHPFLDLVAIGTICDVMTLTGENRVLVRRGLQQLRKTSNLGLQALMERIGQLPEKVDERVVGWTIGPRLNATGRMADAAVGLELLLENNAIKARAIADEIERINTLRKHVTGFVEADARAQAGAILAAHPTRAALALFSPRTSLVPAGEGTLSSAVSPESESQDAAIITLDELTETIASVDSVREASATKETASPAKGAAASSEALPELLAWHPGVVGVAAPRIVSATNCSTFLFAWDGHAGQWKGSGRAPQGQGVNLHAALKHIADTSTGLIAKYGGHAEAAGVSLATATSEGLQEFADLLDQTIAAQREAFVPETQTSISSAPVALSVQDLTPDFLRFYKMFGPFGHDAPAPSFHVAGELIEAVTMGKQPGKEDVHLRLIVRQGSQTIKVIGWNAAAGHTDLLAGPFPRAIEVVGLLTESEFRDKKEPVLELQHVRLGLQVVPPTTATPTPHQKVARASEPSTRKKAGGRSR